MKVFILRNARLQSNAGLLRIIDAQIKNGYEVSVLSRNRDKSQAKNIRRENYSYQVREIDNYVIELDAQRGAGVKNIWPLIKYQWLLFYLLFKKRKEIDIIHAFDLDTGLVSFLFSQLFGKKMVYHIADFYADSRLGAPGKIYRLIKKMEFFIIQHADATIIANEQRKEQIAGSRPKELAVIHNAPMVDSKELIRLKNKKIIDKVNGQIMLAYVGGLTEPRFINEILEFGAKHPSFAIVLAGYGPLEDKVAGYAETYENIYYLGELSYQDSLAVYAQSDLMFAMYNPKVANHRYSAPNKVYEAMLLEKPIIVARNSGVDQLVQKEGIGLVADYDLADFTKQIMTLVENPKTIEKIKKQLRIAAPRYSWEQMVDRLDHLYKKI